MTKMDVKRYMVLQEKKPDINQALAYISQAAAAISKVPNVNQALKMKNLLDYMQAEAEREGFVEVEKKIAVARLSLLDKTGELIEEKKKEPDFGKPGPKADNSVLPEPISKEQKLILAKSIPELGIPKKEAIKAVEYHNLPEEEKTKRIVAEVAKVGQPRTRQKIIDDPRPHVIGKITGKTIFTTDHFHDFVYCDCGEKLTLNRAIEAGKSP